jgi:MFS family permease
MSIAMLLRVQETTSGKSLIVPVSALSATFAWYDFYIFVFLAPILGGAFFPADSSRATLLAAFATYVAGFLARPFGAVFFGRMGDRLGRKHAFLLTLFVLGASTVAMGLLPTFARSAFPIFGTLFGVGWIAPILLLSLRLLQGFAFGGAQVGAAIYVAENAGDRRGYATSWIAGSALFGLLLALAMIALCRDYLYTASAFAAWGWRTLFLVSVVLLAVWGFFRLRAEETEEFVAAMKEGGRTQKSVAESLAPWSRATKLLLLLLGATAGQGVVCYTAQIYPMFFLTDNLKLTNLNATYLVGLSLVIGAPFYVFFGWLSDRIGRFKIIMAGCLMAALTYAPLFGALTHYINPELQSAAAGNPITITADASTCGLRFALQPRSALSNCEQAEQFLVKRGLRFHFRNEPGLGDNVKLTLGATTIVGWDSVEWIEVLSVAGYASAPSPHAIKWVMAEAVLVLLMIYAAMVSAPMTAFLVEQFPQPQTRYASMALPYDIGSGWFGGLLPLVGGGLAALFGHIHFVIWFSTVVAAMSFLIGTRFLYENES